MKKYIDENEYALVVTVDQDDLGRATGESSFSLLYSDGNRWTKEHTMV